MGYAKEFNHENYLVPHFLLEHPWRDMSWHNDTAPRFENWVTGYAVWVDCIDRDKREFDDWKQYSVVGLIYIDTDEVGLQDEIDFATESAENVEKWLFYAQIRSKLLKIQDLLSNFAVPEPEIADETATLLAILNEKMDSLE